MAAGCAPDGRHPHALVVVHHGRTVDSAGVRLHLGTPAFYVESASALLLSRRQRLIQAAAGVWAEWLFTSVVALWLWRSPVAFAIPLLHRFVILNAATIATNLAPFTGLDGSWLLADALRAPDLGRRSRGSASRLLTAWASKKPTSGEDRALAAYSTLNGIAAAGLLATAGFFWYQLFGGLAAALARHGVAGWLALAVAAAVLAMPALTAAMPRLAPAAAGVRALHGAITFRLQWRWRIPATRHLAAAVLQFANLNGHQLGILAGHLHRTRARQSLAAHVTAPGYGIVLTGSLTATTGSGHAITLGSGDTWGPHHQLQQATRRAILISLDPIALRHVLTASPGE